MSYEHAEGYKIRNQAGLHFLTFSVMGWIDVFSRQSYRDIIIDSFQYCRKNKGLQVGAFVIMSNHIHTIWKARESNLSDVIRDFKTYTSKAISNSIADEPESRRDWLLHMFRFYANRTATNENFKVWTNQNHLEEIFTAPFLYTKLNYIHMNPVRAGLVSEPESYLYSSAANYAGMKSVMEIDFLN